jgi:beta-glucoside kinase
LKKKYYLSFDIGGTHVKWGLLDNDGSILEKDHFSSDSSDGATILQKIRGKIKEFQSKVEGIAISAPGFINPSTGFIEKGGAIKEFDNLNLQTLLQSEFNLPVSIENDVNCVAFAEKWLGNGKNLADFICLTVGTGIGGALFLNNKIYRGHSFRGGEFGFMITQGLHGVSPEEDSLSTHASMRGIRKKYAEYYSLPFNEVTGEQVFQAYDEKDPVAVTIVEKFYESLALGIYNITSVLNPEKVLIGGGITSRPSFIKELEKHLTYIDRVFHIEIDACHFRNDAGLIGALAFHKSKYNNTETVTS